MEHKKESNKKKKSRHRAGLQVFPAFEMPNETHYKITTIPKTKFTLFSQFVA